MLTLRSLVANATRKGIGRLRRHCSNNTTGNNSNNSSNKLNHPWRTQPTTTVFNNQRSYTVNSSGMDSLFHGQLHSENYAKYRPTYGPEVVQQIIDYCTKQGSGFERAVDVACGSGQSTVPLTQHFKDVIGVDTSPTQLANAPRIANVRYVQAHGEDMAFIESRSVDLVSMSQALHWMNLPAFYAEVRRVLRPRGVLCVYGYGNNCVDSPAAQELVTEFYEETLRGHWSPARAHIDNNYADMSLPFPDYHRVDVHSIDRRMPLSDFVGYMSTWHAYPSLLKLQPQSTVLQHLHTRLAEVYGSTQVANPQATQATNPQATQATNPQATDPLISVTWPVFMLMAHASVD